MGCPCEWGVASTSLITIEPHMLHRQLAQWIGEAVYVHLEVNPGAYWRNGQANLQRVHVKGDGPYRVFLELAGQGLIHIDEVTHMTVADDLVTCTGYDDSNRLARTLEVSRKPFSL